MPSFNLSSGFQDIKNNALYSFQDILHKVSASSARGDRIFDGTFRLFEAALTKFSRMIGQSSAIPTCDRPCPPSSGLSFAQSLVAEIRPLEPHIANSHHGHSMSSHGDDEVAS